MRLRTDATGSVRAVAGRVALERVARAAALACIAAAMWLAWFGVSSRDNVSPAVPPLQDASAVAAWLADPRTVEATLALDAIPGRDVRAVLHAGRQAGVALAWRASARGGAVIPFAVSAESLRDPRGGMVVRVAANSTGSAPMHLVLRDAVGVLDSAPLQVGGAQWVVRGVPRAVSVVVEPREVASGTEHSGTEHAGAVHAAVSLAHATPFAAGALRRVLVLGVPSWETRFTVLALEEAGWVVDGAVSVAPNARVVTGASSVVRSGIVAPALDTSRYAAVVALDSSAWVWGARIATFVRQGGGAVLLADAVNGAPPGFPRVSGLVEPVAPIPGALTGARPKEGLPLRPLAATDGAVVVLDVDRRTGRPLAAVAARALGAGRVLQVGWGSLWEWRMGGGDNAVEEHRGWWREALARVAPRSGPARVSGASSVRGGGAQAGVSPSVHRAPGDAAPYADLVVRLGAPSRAGLGDSSDGATAGRSAPVPRAEQVVRGVRPPLWLFMATGVLLLAEWWSRRLRGAR